MDSDPDWEFREKVITIIERHLSHSAVVRRNVYLPVLNSESGRTRQCDIVIEEGLEPRKTISIVEVQKRGSKPKINEFNGWVEKMREVGAQYLICVSEAGFPKSIKEKADQIGPTVRLMTYNQLEKEIWPIPPTAFSEILDVVTYIKLNGYEMEHQHLIRVNLNKSLPNPFEKIFRINEDQLLSPTDIVDWHLFGIPKNLDELPRDKDFALVVEFKDEFEHLTYSGKWVGLKRLKISIDLRISSKTVNWEAATYEQRGWGEISWVLRASTIVDGKPFDLITPLSRVAPGKYSMGRPIIMGDHKAFLSLGEKGYKTHRYSDNHDS